MRASRLSRSSWEPSMPDADTWSVLKPSSHCVLLAFNWLDTGLQARCSKAYPSTLGPCCAQHSAQAHSFEATAWERQQRLPLHNMEPMKPMSTDMPKMPQPGEGNTLRARCTLPERFL